MIDVDRFKAICAAGGHLEGDRLLESLAQALTAAVHGSDSMCRSALP